MSETASSPTEPETPASPWLFIIGSVVIVLLVAIIFAAIILREPGGKRGEEPPPFDPALHSELEIKGQQPDGTMSWAAIHVPPPPEFNEALVGKGRGIFQKACAGCHGLGGNGDGPITRKIELSTMPADLTQPLKWIKIHSTIVGSAPTREDLYRTITRGLPGTAMLSFREMAAEDRWALVAFVRSLSSLYEKRAGEPLALPEKLLASEELLAAGKAFYQRNCRTCHGEDGLGVMAGLQNNTTGKIWPGLAFARQKGTRMLGSSSEDDIARTLLTGFYEGHPMLSWKTVFYPEADPAPEARAALDRRFWGTVWYVKRVAEDTPEK